LDDVAIETTRTACAGAASAYALRRVAARAGSYAPGIDERLFFELSRDERGVDLIQVARWFAVRGPELSRLGYRIGVRLVAFRTAAIADWVSGGEGYRAAVLATACQVLHPDVSQPSPSAVALICDAERGEPALRMVDPWPIEPNLRDVDQALPEAHRRVLHRALLLYWFGWS
jgi:hypothetical protein